jgi:hypothetical protein
VCYFHLDRFEAAANEFKKRGVVEDRLFAGIHRLRKAKSRADSTTAVASFGNE